MTTTAQLDRIESIQRAFKKMGCAQLHDASNQYTHVLRLPITARVPGKQLAGPVFPVITHNDMLPCLQALDMAPKDSILFIHNVAEQSEALAGDIYVTAAKSQGISGIIINGAIRDIDFLAEIDLPVYSRDVTYVSAKTAQVPAAELPSCIDFEDFTLELGDWIFADSDGLLVVKEKHLSAVFNGAVILQNREQELKDRLKKGERLGELCGLRDFLEGRGPLKFDA